MRPVISSKDLSLILSEDYGQKKPKDQGWFKELLE